METANRLITSHLFHLNSQLPPLPPTTSMFPSSLVDFIDDSTPSTSTSSTPIPQSPAQRVRPRAVASSIRPGATVHPLSAYINSPAHSRAIAAKPESQVLKTFLVRSLCVCGLIGLGGGS